MSTPTSLPAEPGFAAEIRDSISLRTVGLVVAVLGLQLGFILSYVGAFHSPRPQRIPVSVVAPAQVADRLVAGLNGIPDEPVVAAVAEEAAARASLGRGETSGVLIVNQSGTQDTLLVSSGGGTSVATAVEQIITRSEAAQQRTVTVTDAAPLQSGDGRGLTGFYLTIGWIVGGYLVAALLGVARGARPANPRRAVIRLVALVPYAVLSGLGGALIVDQFLGALTGHFVALWLLLGILIVYGAAAVTMAFQVLFGVVGIGLTVLIFVILGNPSAGGAYQPTLLPPFWRALSPALPNGAGTDTVRRIIYFGSEGIGGHIVVLAAYAVAGTVLALGASLLHRRRVRVMAAA